MAFGTVAARFATHEDYSNALIGSADQLLGLHRLTSAGELAGGDIVALTSLGGGMRWAVTLPRV